VTRAKAADWPAAGEHAGEIANRVKTKLRAAP
jgi:hypothetical protein